MAKRNNVYFEVKEQTNGETPAEELMLARETFLSYIEQHFDNVREVFIFYYGPRLLMVDVKLTNGSYGTFHITAKKIKYGGCTCTLEENSKFERATCRDELYKGEIIL